MGDFARTVRRRINIIRHAGKIDALFEEVEKALPCPTPDCQDFRHRMRRVVEREHGIH